jgi:hypothetical protein
MINSVSVTARGPKLILLFQVYTRFSRGLKSNQIILFVWPAERSLVGRITLAYHKPKRFGFLGGILKNVFGRRTGSRLSKITESTRLPSVTGLL